MKQFFRAMVTAATIAAGLSIAATLPARALVEIDVNKGNVEPLPIAITDFLSGDALGAEIAGIVAADLKRSGLFAPIDKGAFIEKISNPDAAPRFEDWKVINAQALVTGRVSEAPAQADYPEDHFLALGSGDVAVFPGELPRRDRPVVLVVSPWPPYPLAHGGAVRIYNLMRRVGLDPSLFRNDESA